MMTTVLIGEDVMLDLDQAKMVYDIVLADLSRRSKRKIIDFEEKPGKKWPHNIDYMFAPGEWSK